ncbi:MAG: OsmC family protein [Myxococcaceae bacterium]|nr:OsmC family protein [Myxococcaceae bacterium]
MPAPATGVTMSLALEGLQCSIKHDPSGSQLTTVPPKDNGGTGATFSPTDLVGAALASCAVTTIALVAAREGLTFGGARATVEKRMSPPPRRIAELVLLIDMPAGTKPEQRARLEEIARTCPVARSLHPDVKVPFIFRYPEMPFS